MSLGSRPRFSGRPPGFEVYRKKFLRDVHHLVARGFQALAGQNLSTREETAITGLLTAAIETFLDHPEAPEWTERYSVQDERHLNDTEREGRYRLRVDIELTGSGSRPRPRFQVEAKRLRAPEAASLAAYLGNDGLGSFLQSRYAAEHPWAGMMGYVQTRTARHWARRIHEALLGATEPSSSQENGLQPVRLDPLLPDVYRSDHLRADREPIEIHHFLLHCC